jgi:hypothetical protein
LDKWAIYVPTKKEIALGVSQSDFVVAAFVEPMAAALCILT